MIKFYFPDSDFEMFYVSKSPKFSLNRLQPSLSDLESSFAREYYGSRVGGGKPRSWAKAQFLSRPPVPFFFPSGCGGHNVFEHRSWTIVASSS